VEVEVEVQNLPTPVDLEDLEVEQHTLLALLDQ
jgi:hypothetical protein